MRHLRPNARPVPVDLEVWQSLTEDFLQLLAQEVEEGSLKEGILFKIPAEIESGITGEDIEFDLLAVGRYLPGKHIVREGALGVRKSDGSLFLLVYVNLNISPKEIGRALATGIVAPQVERVIIHELTHLLEPVRSKGFEDRDMSKLSASDYYNHPDEVRAFLQEMVYDLKKKTKLWPKLESYFGASQGLKTFMNMSETWHEVEEHLTEKNRKKFVKAASLLLADEGLI